MLVLADRGFFSFDLWRDYMATGTALLWRLSTTMHLKPMTFLPDGSYLAEIVSKSVRGGRTRIALANVGGDLQLATHIPVRVIEYRVENDATTSETFRLITTIVDPPHPVGPAAQDEGRLDVRCDLGPAYRPGRGLGAGPVVEARAGYAQRLAHQPHRQLLFVVVCLLRGNERELVAHCCSLAK